MTLNEAKKEIQSRLTESLRRDYAKFIPEYFESLEIAVQCMDAQIRVKSMYDALADSVDNDSMLSADILKEMLSHCFYFVSTDEVIERLDELTGIGKQYEVNNSDE